MKVLAVRPRTPFDYPTGTQSRSDAIATHRVCFEKSRSIKIAGFWFLCDTWVTDEGSSSKARGKQRHIRLRYNGPESYDFRVELKGSDSAVYAEGMQRAEQWIKSTPGYIRKALHFGRGHNLIVAGRACVGKSSLINALRGLCNNEEGAAEVTFLGKASISGPTQYKWRDDATLWDVPGPVNCGSVRNTQESYYSANEMSAFDTIIILYDKSFDEECAHLLKQAQIWKQRIVFVRTKADFDTLKLTKIGFSEEDAIKQVRKEVEDDFFRSPGKDYPLFIVSALWSCCGFLKFDVEKLQEIIL